MIIMHNSAAMMALGELKKNDKSLASQTKKLGTGQKINGAGDDASGYAISERMRVQIRSLDQDTVNVQTGKNLLRVADGAIANITDELRSLKELAINAANDHNTDLDRATIQKEFDQRRAQIEDIASSTNYNGKLLLTGLYARYQRAQNSDNDQVGGARGATSVPPTAFAPESTPITISGTSDYVISAGGIYAIADGYQGTISVNTTDAVMLQQAGSAALSHVFINATIAGSNVWLNNLNINNDSQTQDNAKSTVSFTGAGNTLTLLGTSTLTQGADDEDKAVVNIGGGLTVNGNGSTLNIINYSAMGAGIGTDANSQTQGSAALTISDANFNIINGRGALDDDNDFGNGNGAAVGSGVSGTIGDITIENSTITAKGGTFAAIGSGYNGASCGDIVIKHSTITEKLSIDTCIGSGYSNSRCGNIRVEDSIVHFSNSDSAGIGSGDKGSTCGDIYVSNTEVVGKSNHGAAIGSGRDRSRAGNIIVTNGSTVKHTSPNPDNPNGAGDGAAIGSGQNSTVGTISLSPSVIRQLDASGAYRAQDHVIPGVGHGRGGSAGDVAGVSNIADDGGGEIRYVEGNPLIIHTGTKSNQHLRVYLNDMHPKALKGQITNASGEFVNEDDLNILKNLSGNPKAKRVYEGILRAADGKTLDDVSVNTRYAASVTMRVVEGAIDYVLGEATTVGAYISRLDKTEDNLVTASENTQSSESTIRDADMAKEMTSYAKANILSQSAQAMLAQANQNSSSVLSLLQ